MFGIGNRREIFFYFIVVYVYKSRFGVVLIKRCLENVLVLGLWVGNWREEGSFVGRIIVVNENKSVLWVFEIKKV